MDKVYICSPGGREGVHGKGNSSNGHQSALRAVEEGCALDALGLQKSNGVLIEEADSAGKGGFSVHAKNTRHSFDSLAYISMAMTSVLCNCFVFGVFPLTLRRCLHCYPTVE